VVELARVEEPAQIVRARHRARAREHVGEPAPTATEWNAPIDAPAAQIARSSALQSARIAGATSWARSDELILQPHLVRRRALARQEGAAATLSHE